MRVGQVLVRFSQIGGQDLLGSRSEKAGAVSAKMGMEVWKVK